MATIKNILTVDVEDWYHILEVDSSPDLASWEKMQPLVEKNFFTMLDLFDIYQVKTTCFFLGWVAEKFPNLVKEAQNRGHEIASHGYSHRLVYTQSPKEFYADIKKAKDLLEDISGEEVVSYRCPGFSITEETPWAFETIYTAGYKFDSSLFPAARGHGGMADASMEPHIIKTESGELIEIPVSVASFMGKRICFFGGGYLRLFPYQIIKRMARQVNNEKRPVIYYIHPREIDPFHPRLNMSKARTFKSYVNLETTYKKLKKIVSDGNLTTIKEFVSENF